MALDLAVPRPVPVCMPRWTAAREDTRPEPMNFRWSANLYRVRIRKAPRGLALQ
jgi:hypothetical protein